MMALVLMDHALLHRAQNADVKSTTPAIPGRMTGDKASGGVSAASPKINSDPSEA